MTTGIVSEASGSEEEVSIEDAATDLGAESTSVDEGNGEETQALADDADEETTQSLEEGEGEATDEDADLNEFREFVSKAYAGNAKEAIKGIRESWRANKEIRQELNELKEALRPAPEPEKLPDPDVSHLDAELEGYKEDIESVHAELDANISEHRKTQLKLSRLEGKLENAVDNDDKSDLKSEIRELNRDISNLEKDIKAQARRDKELNRKYAATYRRREQELEVQRQRIASNAASRAEQQAADNESVDSTITGLFDTHKIPEGSRQRLHGLVRSEVITYLSSLGNAPAVDLEQVTTVVGESLLKELTAMTKANLEKASGKKLQASVQRSQQKQQQPSQQSRSNQPKTQADWERDAQRVRDRAEKVLGA